MQDFRLILESLRQLDEFHPTVDNVSRKVQVKLQGMRVEIWCQDETLVQRVEAAFDNLKRSGYELWFTIGGRPDMPSRNRYELVTKKGT
jgi:hypothetical protein